MGKTGEGKELVLGLPFLCPFFSFAFLPAFFLSLLVFGNIGVENKICMNFFPRRGPSSGKIWFFWKQSPPYQQTAQNPPTLSGFSCAFLQIEKTF